MIIRWTSLQQLKQARGATVHRFLNTKGGFAVAQTEQRVASIPLTTYWCNQDNEAEHPQE